VRKKKSFYYALHYYPHPMYQAFLLSNGNWSKRDPDKLSSQVTVQKFTYDVAVVVNHILGVMAPEARVELTRIKM